MEAAEEGKREREDSLLTLRCASKQLRIYGTCSAEFMKHVFPRLFRPQSPRAAGFWCEP